MGHSPGLCHLTHANVFYFGLYVAWVQQGHSENLLEFARFWKFAKRSLSPFLAPLGARSWLLRRTDLGWDRAPSALRSEPSAWRGHRIGHSFAAVCGRFNF